MTSVNPYITKSWYKATGKVHINEQTPRGRVLVIVKKGRKLKYMRFWCSNDSEVAPKLDAYSEGSRIKCRFTIQSIKNDQGYWNTFLDLKDVMEWKVNENKEMRKKKAEEITEQKAKNTGLFGPNESDWISRPDTGHSY